MRPKKYLIIIAILFIVSIPVSLTYAAYVPFGGLVTAIQPCNDGLLVWVQTPLQGVLPFKWITGNLPFLMRVPPHPGQFVLGMASVPSPCMLGIASYGAGLTIVFHGSSL